MWLLILIGIFICIVICDLLTDNKPNPCDNCVHRFCVSNQYPTICDDCKDGSNHETEHEWTYKQDECLQAESEDRE